jgi:hypothetical protein
VFIPQKDVSTRQNARKEGEKKTQIVYTLRAWIRKGCFFVCTTLWMQRHTTSLLEKKRKGQKEKREKREETSPANSCIVCGHQFSN